MIGQRFGKLTVIKYVRTASNYQKIYLCKCDCGNTKEIRIGHLRDGSTTSCGCYQRYIVSKANKKYNSYDLSGEYGVGITDRGEQFYFDFEDYQKIKNICWYVNKDGYVVSKYDKKLVLFHRLILNMDKEKEEVDHINHNTSDNTRKNLRVCTSSQNNMNRSIQSNNRSGYQGINWRKDTCKWRAYIKINNKQITLGCFDNFDEAVKTRKEAEEKYFGEFNYKIS